MEIRKSKNEFTYLYLIELTGLGETFWKIGVANKGVKVRYSYEKEFPYDIKVLMEVKMLKTDALHTEKAVKLTYQNKLYIPKHYFAGSKTECFTEIPIVTNTIPKHIELDKIELDLSSINLFEIDFSKHYYGKALCDTKCSYKKLEQDTEYTNTLKKFLYSIASNYSHSFQVNTAPHFKNLLKDKGYTKRINPTKDKFKKNNCILINSFSVTQHGVYKDLKEYTKYIIKEALVNNPNITDIYFVSVDSKQLSRYLEKEISVISLKDFRDKLVKEDKSKKEENNE